MSVIILKEYKLLVEVIDDKISLPKLESITHIKDRLLELHRSESEYVATLQDDIPDTSGNLSLINLRQALNHFPEPVINNIVYYQQLANYYKTHKFCGSCGGLTIRQKHNKFVFCNKCNLEIYPQIAPSVIVRIHRGDDILMARGVNFIKGAWGLVAGFVEIGESLEQAACREVQEEVGIKIKNIRYWGSQAWPFPSSSLMVGFTAEYASGEVTPDTIEIEAAGFFNRNNMPGIPSTTYSIASKMINEYLADSST